MYPRIWLNHLQYRRVEKGRHRRDLFLRIEKRYSVDGAFDAGKFEAAARSELAKTSFKITAVVSVLEDGIKGDGLVFSFRGRPLYEIVFVRSRLKPY